MADPTVPNYPIDTAIYLSLDRSGSMESCRDLITEGVNNFITRMQDDASAKGAQFLLTQWDSQGFDIIRRGALADVKVLGPREFTPRALTPLLDATGFAADQLALANARRNVLVIATDGQENASKKWKLPQLKDHLKHLQSPEGGRWIIIYLAAHVDAWEQAEGMGIPKERAMNFKAGHGSRPASGMFSRWRSPQKTNPFSLALLAAGGLAAGYLLLRPDQADASLTPLGFTDADRASSMGVDGITTTWQQAVKEDIVSWDEPFKGILDLPPDLAALEATLPKDFDPAKGSLNEDNEQPGQPEGDVLDEDDYEGTWDPDEDDDDDDDRVEPTGSEPVEVSPQGTALASKDADADADVPTQPSSYHGATSGRWSSNTPNFEETPRYTPASHTHTPASDDTTTKHHSYDSGSSGSSSDSSSSSSSDGGSGGGSD